MIPTNGKTGICETCKSVAELTWDHIVPKWLLTDVSRFGLSNGKLIALAGTEGKMWRSVCTACNVAKGGQVHYGDPIVQSYMRAFIIELGNKILEVAPALPVPVPATPAGPRKLKVACGCDRKEPCAVVPGVIYPREIRAASKGEGGPVGYPQPAVAGMVRTAL